MELKKDTFCFVCGEDNKDGLQLRIERDGDKGVKTTFVADQRYRGWANYLHGGVIGLIFDELLGWNARYLGYDAIRYIESLPDISTDDIESKKVNETIYSIYNKTDFENLQS